MFTIVNGKQLNIEVNDVKPEELVLKKIINGILAIISFLKVLTTFT